MSIRGKIAAWLRRAPPPPTEGASPPASPEAPVVAEKSEQQAAADASGVQDALKVEFATAAVPAASNLPPTFQRYADYVRVHPSAVIAPTAALKIFTLPSSPRVCLEIGANSHIFSTFVILRPDATITVGERCQLGASHFVCAEQIGVGDDVLMAWNVTVMDNDAHALEWEARATDAAVFLHDYLQDAENPLLNKQWNTVTRRRILIGDKTWIGFNASILKGVEIGERAVVGAGSVVTRGVPPRTVVAGNPARVVRELNGPSGRDA